MGHDENLARDRLKKPESLEDSINECVPRLATGDLHRNASLPLVEESRPARLDLCRRHATHLAGKSDDEGQATALVQWRRSSGVARAISACACDERA